jgi:hypothetical protein
VAAKKRSSRKPSRPGKPSRSTQDRQAPKSRQGLSGNPQRRAEQLRERAQRQEPYSQASDAGYARRTVKPVPWWPESRASILARVRGTEWPTRLFDVETLAGKIVGDEFHVRVNTPDITGLYPVRWLEALTDEVEDALGTEIVTGGGDWPQLWAFLCGLHDAIVPLKLESAASLLADRGLIPSVGYPIAGWQPAGDALVARDAYGSRFLVVAPFGEAKTDMQDGPTGSPEPDHWYAWDLDWCSLDMVVAAGPRGSAAEALAEWRHAVGPVAASAELSPGPPDLTVRLLHPALALGTLWEAPLMGGEPVKLMREYFRLYHRARVLAEYLIDRFPEQTKAEAEEPEAEDPAESFLDWYAERDGASSPSRDQAAEAVECILAEWGPFSFPDEEMLYACSPHRIEVTGGLLRDGYEPDQANAALRLLPAWTQWCLRRRPITPEAAARSAEAATNQAALLVNEDYVRGSDEERDPFLCQE